MKASCPGNPPAQRNHRHRSAADAALIDITHLAFMGTVVSAGEGWAVVYATGNDA